MLNSQAGYQRNLKLYPYYSIIFRLYAWAPIFFLYFSEKIPIGQVLYLESIYYFSVCLLEVPSGSFSDRIGRRTTLIIASLFQTLAYFLFFMADGFELLCLGQVALAMAFAFNSGTDESFHYESLKELGKEDDFGELEAKLMKKGMLFRALAQLTAGLLGVWAMKSVYGFSALLSFVTLFLAFQFTDISSHSKKGDGGFLGALRYYKIKKVLWISLFLFIFVIVTHFPFEFYQSYLSLLDPWPDLSFDETTVLAGIVNSAAIFIAAFVAGYSIRLKNKIGFERVIYLALLFNLIVLGAMSFFLSSWVAVLLLLRSMPSALSRSPIRAELAPIISNKDRATFMSMNSLIGRLGYGGVLLFLGQMSSEETMTWPVLKNLIFVGLVIGGVGLALLLILRAFARADHR